MMLFILRVRLGINTYAFVFHCLNMKTRKQESKKHPLIQLFYPLQIERKGWFVIDKGLLAWTIYITIN